MAEGSLRAPEDRSLNPDIGNYIFYTFSLFKRLEEDETNEKEVGEVGPEMQQKERDIKQDRDWELRKLKNIFCCLSRKKEKSNQ